jgi:hypothetical protein
MVVHFTLFHSIDNMSRAEQGINEVAAQQVFGTLRDVFDLDRKSLSHD